MVEHDFQFQDFAARLGGDLGDDDLESLGNLARQNLPAVLRASDDVVLARVGDVIAGLELLRHTALRHILQDNALTVETPIKSMERISCFSEGAEPYIPVAKARGLSAPLW